MKNWIYFLIIGSFLSACCKGISCEKGDCFPFTFVKKDMNKKASYFFELINNKGEVIKKVNIGETTQVNYHSICYQSDSLYKYNIYIKSHDNSFIDSINGFKYLKTEVIVDCPSNCGGSATEKVTQTELINTFFVYHNDTVPASTPILLP